MRAVTATTTDSYTTYIKGRQHELIADEPTEMGGDDKGMTPGELLCASLASCTTITLRMYIDRKEWDVEEIRTKVQYAQENREVLEKTIYIKGDLDEKQLKRLLVISAKCPIHKMLMNNLTIESSLG